MSRHSRTPDHPCPNRRCTRPTAGLREKILVRLGTCLALSCLFAAAAAAVFSIIPATSTKVDPDMRGPAGPFTFRLVGLDHSGGDLRRAVRLTRRATRLRFGQPWVDGIGALPKQARYHVAIASP